MEQINNRERRVSKAKYYGIERRKTSSLILRIFKRSSMCSKAFICPEFERRTINGIKSACENCEYIKKERKTIKKCRITLFCVFVIFIISTYFKYN